MKLIHQISDWYEDAKDYFAEFLCNGPNMVRVKFSEGAGEHWTNYHGWVSKAIWNCDARRTGLIYLMSEVGIMLGWHSEAGCFPASVRLVDTVLDRKAHRVAPHFRKRRAASRKTRGKKR